MQPDKNPLSAMISFLVTVSGLLLAVFAGGLIWNVNYTLQWVNMLILGVGAVSYLLWRVIKHKAQCFRTPVDGWVAGLLFLLLLFWAFSPNPRMGFSHMGAFLLYWVLFNLLFDLYSIGLDRKSVLAALLFVSGLLLVFAGLEVYYKYNQFWMDYGSRAVQPPFPYRMVTLVGHSNSFMGLVNLCAPLALFLFFSSKKRFAKIGLGIWLSFYMIAIPFASSRGGWMGMAAWAGMFAILALIEEGYWRKVSAFLRSNILWSAAGGVSLAAVGGYFLYRFWIYFAAHPSHGGNPFSGRSIIWANALKVWQSSPWIGVGPGRFGAEYLRAAPETIPQYWPSHAHNMLIEFMAEFGVLGMLGLLFMLAGLAIWLWRQYRSLPDSRRWYGRAILAAAAGWATQMGVDDQTSQYAVMVPLVVLLAWLAAAGKDPLPRRRVSLGWFLIPVAGLLFMQAFALYGYAPYAHAVADAGAENWKEIALAAEESAARDPHFSFYSTQAGFAWAAQWQKDHDPQTLNRSRQAFQTTLTLEPDMALWWANLAVLDWQAGDTQRALEHIQTAIRLGPDEPSYHLNQAWFYEQQGDNERAFESYTRVLQLWPQWSSHPFWQLTELRQRVLNAWQNGQPVSALEGAAYWQQAQEAADRGQMEEARRLLVTAEWVGEPNLAIWNTRGQIAAQMDDRKTEERVYAEILNWMDQPHLETYGVSGAYSQWFFKRVGLSVDIVPQYMQLMPDVGQFDALQRLTQRYIQQKSCSQAQKSWQVWQRAVRGNSSDGIPAFTGCVSEP